MGLLQLHFRWFHLAHPTRSWFFSKPSLRSCGYRSTKVTRTIQVTCNTRCSTHDVRYGHELLLQCFEHLIPLLCTSGARLVLRMDGRMSCSLRAAGQSDRFIQSFHYGMAPLWVQAPCNADLDVAIMIGSSVLRTVLQILGKAGVGDESVIVIVVAEFPVYQGRRLPRQHGFERDQDSGPSCFWRCLGVIQVSSDWTSGYSLDVDRCTDEYIHFRFVFHRTVYHSNPRLVVQSHRLATCDQPARTTVA